MHLCAAAGDVCVYNSVNLCAPGACTESFRRCDGNVHRTCNLGLGGGYIVEVDCTEQSGTCSTTEPRECVRNGPACTRPNIDVLHFDGIRCDGDTLVDCVGQESPRDCAQFGLRCFSVSDVTRDDPQQPVAVARCQAGNECDPITAPASCNGTVLTFCNNGLNRTIDCAALGFAGCKVDDGGQCTK